MQQAITALSTASLSVSTEPHACLPVELVEHVFARLSAQLGSKVGDVYAGVPADLVKTEWRRALADFRPEEIQRGLAATATRIFAPNLGEFSRLCRPALDPEAAWHEAKDGLRARDRGEDVPWSHPAVLRAAEALSWELRNYAYKDRRGEWAAILQRELRKGWDLPEPPLAIGYKPAPPPAPSFDEWVRHVEQMRDGQPFAEQASRARPREQEGT